MINLTSLRRLSINGLRRRKTSKHPLSVSSLHHGNWYKIDLLYCDLIHEQIL